MLNLSTRWIDGDHFNAKEPLINHRYFITIDKSIHECSIFGTFWESDFL